jgi:hypothetical protein
MIEQSLSFLRACCYIQIFYYQLMHLLIKNTFTVYI